MLKQALNSTEPLICFLMPSLLLNVTKHDTKCHIRPKNLQLLTFTKLQSICIFVSYWKEPALKIRVHCSMFLKKEAIIFLFFFFLLPCRVFMKNGLFCLFLFFTLFSLTRPSVPYPASHLLHLSAFWARLPGMKND